MESPGPVRDSVKEITENSWLIGRKKILRLVPVQEQHENVLLRNKDGSCYILDDAPDILPPTKPTPTDGGHVRKIYDAGESSAVFDFHSSLILKVKLVAEGPKEHETIAFLAKRQLSFDIPTVLSFTQDADTSYLFEPRIPGRTLNDAWWDMDADTKQRAVVFVAKVCCELAALESDTLTVADLNWINPLLEDDDPRDTPETLREHYESLGMDCSTYIFAHNDLAASNVMIDDDGRRLTVIDWEVAGYYPRAWVRTKFAVCGALDVERVREKLVETNSEYRKGVEEELSRLGFPEVTDAYQCLRKARKMERVKNRP